MRASVEAVFCQPRIRVVLSARVVRIDGQPGMFEVTLEVDSLRHTIRVGAIVVATGWKPYDASRLAHLGYGSGPNVVTSVEFEQMAVKGPIVRPSDGRPVKRVLFIQCAGSRDKDHLPYCSSACCMTTLAQTTYIHEQDPKAELLLLVYQGHSDARTVGAVLPRSSGPAAEFFHQGRSGIGGERAGRTAGSHGKPHREAILAGCNCEEEGPRG